MLRFIPTNATGVITQFGKFERLAFSGLNVYIPFIQSLHLVSNKLCEYQSNLTVRTADKVFTRIDIALQYKVKAEDSDRAYFELSQPTEQMNSYTDNVVRKVSSHLTLDQLFESHSHISDAILSEVGPKMKAAGFTIESAQVRNIAPPEQIVKSMNEINASQRRRVAAQFDGQATKIKAVLLAEAEAMEKELRGKGIASMRANITEGWVSSVKDMAEKTGTNPQEVLSFLIRVLQQQTMENMSKNAGTKVIFMDSSENAGIDSKKYLQALEAHDFQGEEAKTKK